MTLAMTPARSVTPAPFADGVDIQRRLPAVVAIMHPFSRSLVNNMESGKASVLTDLSRVCVLVSAWSGYRYLRGLGPVLSCELRMFLPLIGQRVERWAESRR